jgi:hypothetical protein
MSDQKPCPTHQTSSCDHETLELERFGYTDEQLSQMAGHPPGERVHISGVAYKLPRLSK